MTGRQNRVLVRIGCAGLLLLFLAAITNAAMYSYGYRDAPFRMFIIDIWDYLWFPSSQALALGMILRFTTEKYLAGDFDGPKYSYMQFGFIRFFLLISDDPRVFWKRVIDLRNRHGITFEQAKAIIERHGWDRDAANRAADVLKHETQLAR